MKILKLKSLIYSLFAVALVSVFLTSCERNEVVDNINQEVLSLKINPEVAAAIEDINLLTKEELDNVPTHLPTGEEIEELTVNFRNVAPFCWVNRQVGGPPCGFGIQHNADWDLYTGNCPSNWTWVNLQKRRANGNFTTEWSGLKKGDYNYFSPVTNLNSGEYLTAIFAWNHCQQKWTMEASVDPWAPCD